MQGYIAMLTPLLLALKSLVSCSEEMKEELSVNISVMRTIMDAVSKTFGDTNNYMHLHIAGMILMCELEYSAFDKLIQQRITEMKTMMESANENKKVRF